jgi:hypothetical protein
MYRSASADLNSAVLSWTIRRYLKDKKAVRVPPRKLGEQVFGRRKLKKRHTDPSA